MGDISAEITRIQTFHSTFFPSYGSTPLHPLSSLAKSSNIAGLYLKDERDRCGLPAFKILGASWALCSVLAEKWGGEPGDLEGLRRCSREGRQRGDGLTVIAATDGNHGRAVARTASQIGLACTIYVPQAVEEWSRQAIRSEGATVQVVEGDYDETIMAARQAAEDLGERGILIQDTSWDGYSDIPMRIVKGYTKLFFEISTQLPVILPHPRPTHIIVPVGVGSLAHAAVLYTMTFPPASRPRIITVEPTTAACLSTALASQPSASSSSRASAPDPLSSSVAKDDPPQPIKTGATIMPGLNCGTVSPLAWPDLRSNIRPGDAVRITDNECREAMAVLEREGIEVGPCGAAALAALNKVELPEHAVVVLICTEGPAT